MNKGDNKSWADEYGNIHFRSDELARGGQGVVYQTKDEDLAVKQPLTPTGKLDRQINTCNIFRRIRTLPLPHGIPISLPLAILRDEPGYVMKLLKEMKPFTSFFLDGEKRKAVSDEKIPTWLSGIKDNKFSQDLAYYAQTGSTRRRLYALYKCASILARLHNAGIVYGDISTNNVFIGGDIPTDCWLIDADNLRFEVLNGGPTVYTPHLGAPEIVQGKDSARPRTDCWAFAVMAFQMLALCHPFIGQKVLEPDEDNGWDATSTISDASIDLDEQAYAGFLPFIDDENDDSNKSFGGLPRQLVLTPQLSRLFQETFCIGRTRPHRRPSMVFWAIELARAFDKSVVCPNCHMSYFYGPDFDRCPYCQTKCPAFALAKTNRWEMNLLGNGKNSFEVALPHRLFHPFSFAFSDSAECNATVHLTDFHVESIRGTKPFPSDLTFERVNTADAENKIQESENEI